MLRTYTSVFVYDRPGHEVARAELPLQPQGESVAADGDRLLVGSEGLELAGAGRAGARRREARADRNGDVGTDRAAGRWGR